METFKIRSSIHSSLMHYTLLKGTLLAGSGAAILLYGSLFMDLEALEKWGIILLCIAGILICAGMLPYRRLTRLERTPNELVAFTDTKIQFFSQGKLGLTLPMSRIARIGYIKRKRYYGIGIWLKDSTEKIIVHNRFNVGTVSKKTDGIECGLFFPYFSEHSFKSLREYTQNT